MNTALIEALKEPLRLLVLALIPFLLTYFGAINSQWALVIVVLLRFLDKLLHEIGKLEDNEAMKRGMTQF